MTDKIRYAELDGLDWDMLIGLDLHGLEAGICWWEPGWAMSASPEESPPKKKDSGNLFQKVAFPSKSYGF